MTYQTSKKRKSALPFVIIFVLILLALVVLAGLSLNKMRNGQSGFITNLWSSTPTPEDDPVLANSGIALPVPAHVKTVLLLGSDYRPESGYRTDVILLAAFNMNTGKVHLISFPRDLWLNIPNYGPQRINVAFPTGGWEMLSDTFAANFGFRPDHYAMVTFDGFEQMIIALNGIEVNVGAHTEDECDLNGQTWCVVEPGKVQMDSKMALWYVRNRKNSSDFDRNRRAQEVIQAIAAKAMNPVNVSRLPKLLKAIEENVETDLDLGNMWPYALPLNKYLQDDLITTYHITPNEAVPFTTDGGASVLDPNIPVIQAILRQVFWIE